MGYLVTQRTLRPIIAVAMTRLIIIWMLFGALPIGGSRG
jgi:hypothetical protein